MLLYFTTMGGVTGIKWKFKVCTQCAKQNKILRFEMLIESLRKVQRYTRFLNMIENITIHNINKHHFFLTNNSLNILKDLFFKLSLIRIPSIEKYK